MGPPHLVSIYKAVRKVCAITGADVSEVVDALTGLAWDEEDAGQIKSRHNEENHSDTKINAMIEHR